MRNGKLTSIIFLRDKNSKGQEVSGYIDYAHRLKSENFESYFERKKKLMPKPSDLSYYNWETQHSTSNSTPNFQVIADNEAGLLFKNKRDRKVINVDPKCLPVCVSVCLCVSVSLCVCALGICRTSATAKIWTSNPCDCAYGLHTLRAIPHSCRSPVCCPARIRACFVYACLLHKAQD